jgi:hypothetical protein
VAERIDTQQGIREVAEFFGVRDRALFGYSHWPLKPPKSGILICSPLLAEFRRNYRREVALGRALATDGYVVQRFHYAGTGHSDGKASDITLDTLRQDALCAAEHLARTANVAIEGVVATRLANAVLGLVIEEFAVSSLALWQPTLRATDYFAEAFRARAFRMLREQVSHDDPVVPPTQEMDTYGVTDILGYSLYRRLYDSIVDQTLEESLSIAPGRILLLRLAPDRRMPKGLQDLAERWRASGSEVDIRFVVNEEPWWLARGDDEGSGDVQTLGRTVSVTRAWLESRVPPTAEDR